MQHRIGALLVGLGLLFAVGASVAWCDDGGEERRGGWRGGDHGRWGGEGARERHREREGNEELSEALGGLCATGFIAANLAYILSLAAGGLRRREGEQPCWATPPRWWRVCRRNLHYIGNAAALAVALVHGLTAEDQTPMLWLAWGVVAFQCACGTAMKLGPGTAIAKPARLLHRCALVLVVMVALHVIAHGGVD